MLYTYSVSIYQSDLDAFLSLLTKHDEVLLIQDGVLAVLEDNPLLIYCLAQQISVYALIDDVYTVRLKLFSHTRPECSSCSGCDSDTTFLLLLHPVHCC